MVLAFDHTQDLDLVVSRSKFEIALFEEWEKLTERKGCESIIHDWITNTGYSVIGYCPDLWVIIVGWVDVPLRLVTGVTSEVSVQSTYLVLEFWTTGFFFLCKNTQTFPYIEELFTEHYNQHKRKICFTNWFIFHHNYPEPISLFIVPCNVLGSNVLQYPILSISCHLPYEG